MRPICTRLVFAALLVVAVLGYFLDLECYVNRCDRTVASCEHGECVSPVVMPPDGAGASPAVLAEFSVLPVLLELAIACAPPVVCSPPLCSHLELRPPPDFLLSNASISRRGPPALA